MFLQYLAKVIGKDDKYLDSFICKASFKKS